MADPILAELNLTTYEEIYPKVVEDMYFKATPFAMHLRERALVPFGGGSRMQNTFLARPLIGGAYAPGDNFNITKVQTLAGTAFDPKYYEVSVPEYKEQILVLNTGNLAVFDLVELDLQNAMNTISAIIAIDLALHGQPSGGSIVGNRPKNLNGWIEAVNDGITPGWDGSIFTAYGTQARNGFVSSSTRFNSTPVFAGNPDGTTGPVTYPTLEEGYQTASVGNQEPDLGAANKALYAYIKERIQPQQRFAQERDPYWGVSGMRMNNAIILKDDYFPSLKYGVNDPFLGNFLTSTFSSPGTTANGGTAAAISNLPVSGTTVNVGEVFAWFNMAKFLFRITDSEEFGFGFSGFIPAQDNTRVVGQVKAAVNLECLAPGLNWQSYGYGI